MWDYFVNIPKTSIKKSNFMKMNVFYFDYDILFNESILMLMGYGNRTLTSNGLSFQMTKNLMFMGT